LLFIKFDFIYQAYQLLFYLSSNILLIFLALDYLFFNFPLNGLQHAPDHVLIIIRIIRSSPKMTRLFFINLLPN